MCFIDNHGAPRPVVNSKGRRRRPGTKTLPQVLRCTDDDFVDFIAQCLIWDPEKRIKPQSAMRHAFVLGHRRARVTSPAPSKSAAIPSSRSKPVETPKKSQIGAPTPLTARISRSHNAALTTPSNSTSVPASGSSNLGASGRSYRTSASSSQFLSRTLNGYSVSDLLFVFILEN